ncbi:UDP-N-acetylmuramoyl-tripeptide--D-alanyl-D-alanine ligase [Candidatus Omnitrophota bacterium]
MFTIAEILDSTGGALLNGRLQLNQRVRGLSIDSRRINPGELFIAIKGTRFDGHNFIKQAQQKGAAAVLFSEDSGINRAGAAIKVKDTISALAALAFRHRQKFNIPVVAITGSNGKTTTKEMVSFLLSAKFKVLSNQGTQNNHIGVPLTILNLSAKHNCAVVEIGANHRGEIDRLSWILQPDVGIITNIGPAHLEFFKSLNGVFLAKLELVRNLKKSGKLIINKDDRFLAKFDSNKFKSFGFGLNRRADFFAEQIKQVKGQTHFLLNGKHRLILNALGAHNVYNALASIACARIFGISISQIKQRLADFQPPPMRMQMLEVNKIKIINDCYNSNPGSLESALEFLKGQSSPGRKVVICGDMLELGGLAAALHTSIGKKIAKDEVDLLITVGELAKNIASAAQAAGMSPDAIRACHNTAEAADSLQRLINQGDTVLIKGSRGMQMENLVQCFINSSIH